jgi:hypothetical protein
MNTTATKIFVGGLFLLLIFPSSIKESRKHISKYKDVSSAIEFIRNHTDEKDKLMFEGPLGPIAIYTGRSLVRPYRLDHQEIKKEIRESGFAETMQKYRIKYLLSPYEKPKYIDYAFLFSDINIRYPSSNRSYLISEKVGTINEDSRHVYSELEEIVGNYNIRNKFHLLENFGKIKIYSFRN